MFKIEVGDQIILYNNNTLLTDYLRPFLLEVVHFSNKNRTRYQIDYLDKRYVEKVDETLYYWVCLISFNSIILPLYHEQINY